MSASGTLFLQTFVFLLELRIFRACQEIRDFLTHGRRRKSPASGLSRTLSATVAGAWPGTKKPATGRPTDCTQIRFCIAGETSPPRRAVRRTQTHAKTCQTIHRTPAIREIAVAAAQAEGRTAAITTTQTVPTVAPMAARKAVADARAATAPVAVANRGTQVASRAPALASHSAALCPLPSS